MGASPSNTRCPASKRAPRRANVRTSSRSSTRCTSSDERTSSGRSSRSAAFSLGSTIVRIPARTAPNTFSFTPPIGSTRPRRVTSPVIARSWRAGRRDSTETSAVAIVTPADGPSFGMAPAGTCMWMSVFANASSGMPSWSAWDLASQLADLALELADASLARVTRDDSAQRGVGDRELLGGEPVFRELPRNEIPLRDLELLPLGVAREGYSLQAIEQRPRNALEEVRGRDEQHLREVERHAEVGIRERIGLRRIEHLEQRRCGVTLEGDAHLVDLVEQEHGFLGTRLLHALDDPPRHGADVGAPVAADVRLVAGTAERDADVRPAHGPRDRLGDRRLADARGPDEQEDLAPPPHVVFVALRHGVGRALPQLAHRQELEDLIFHVLEAVVILLEDLRGPLQVERLLRPLVPRQF